MNKVAPFSKVTSVRHQMMFIAQGWTQGAGITSDWSECSAIEREPGRAMLAVKFEIRNVSPSSERTMSIATGCWIRSQNSLSSSSR